MQVKEMLRNKCAEYLTRYTEQQRQVITDYWEIIRCTRKTGTVSANIMQTEMAYWRRFDADIVIAALQEHINQRPDYRESYTRGIMRNMQQAKNNGQIKRPNKHYSTRQRPAQENFKSEIRDLDFLIE